MSARLEESSPPILGWVLGSFKKIFAYIERQPTWPGLVQPQDKIVDRCAITIYPYSFGPEYASGLQAGEWDFNQSCSAASTRVCQPSPVARNCATTSGDSRIVIRCFVGACCGPRTPNFERSEAGNASLAGRILLISAALNSRTSPRLSISGLRFGISIDLSKIRFAKTDDSDTRFSLGETKNM